MNPKTQPQLFHHQHPVTPDMRSTAKGHQPLILWFTGLSGSGKSTLAGQLELLLHQSGIHTTLLDGDNVRSGLTSDLGLSEEDRNENNRRISEVAGLFLDAGLVVLCAFITPYRSMQQSLKERFGDRLKIIHVDTPFEECRKRDPKGLYAKYDQGLITCLTGVDAPYEAPENPDFTIDTRLDSPTGCAQSLFGQLRKDLL